MRPSKPLHPKKVRNIYIEKWFDPMWVPILIWPKEVPIWTSQKCSRDNKKHPQNAYDAQFSVHYIMAATLTRGQFTLDELEDNALSDPIILDLCSKASYEFDPESAYPKYYSGEVVIETTDGRTLSHREAINRGSADNPVSTTDIEDKFFANATRTVSRIKAEEVRTAVMSLEKHETLKTLANSVAM